MNSSQYFAVCFAGAPLLATQGRLTPHCSTNTNTNQGNIRAVRPGRYHRKWSWQLNFDKVPATNPYGDDSDSDDEEESGGSGGKGKGKGGKGGGGGRGGDGSGGSEESDSLFGKLMFMWNKAIRDRPLITKIKLTVFLNVVGDLIAQKLESHGDFKLNWRRTMNIALITGCIVAPHLHGWYLFLDRLYPGGALAPLKKMATDQLIFSLYLNSLFVASLSALQGMNLKQIQERVKERLWPTAIMNWKLWPAAQFINFTFIPSEFQIVWVNSVGLLWSVMLSMSAHKKAAPASAPVPSTNEKTIKAKKK